MNFLNNLRLILPVFAYSFTESEVILHTSIKNLNFSVFCLKKHLNYQYSLLSCISGVDNVFSKYRFSVVYELLSITFSSRIRLKIHLNEISSVASVVEVFTSANWWEREIWDLFGLYFYNHPDLRRILTDYGFEGHPMRKDFPLSGFIELKYDLGKKQIVADKLELAQNFRYYNYEMPW